MNRRKERKKGKIMKIDVKRNRLSLFTFLIFVVTSITLFIYLNRVQPYYFIDEVFHIPQTQRYCEGNFTSVSIFLNLNIVFKYFLVRV